MCIRDSAFYSAWKVHLLAGIVMLQMQEGASKEEPATGGAVTEPETDLAELQRLCDDWQRLFKEVPSPFFESYHGGIWPCDTLPAIHAMKTCDRITNQNKYQGTIDQWLKDVKQTLDSETGLIPHSNLADGKQTGQGRATSQMIILRMMPDIDEAFARQQYELFRDCLLYTSPSPRDS